LVKEPGVHFVELLTEHPVNLENFKTALYPFALEEIAYTSAMFGIPAITLAANLIFS
jgi:hypothetical protein